MKYHVFSCSLNDDGRESIQEVLNMVTDLDCDLTVYLDSNGGYSAWAENLIKAFNTKTKYITLVGGPELSSAALLLWLGFKGRKDVSVGLSSTAHMGTIKAHLRDGKLLPYDNSTQDSISMSKFSTPLIKTLLTPKQLVAYKSGLDITVTYNQLKKHAIAHNKTL